MSQVTVGLLVFCALSASCVLKDLNQELERSSDRPEPPRFATIRLSRPSSQEEATRTKELGGWGRQGGGELNSPRLFWGDLPPPRPGVGAGKAAKCSGARAPCAPHARFCRIHFSRLPCPKAGEKAGRGPLPPITFPREEAP